MFANYKWTGPADPAVRCARHLRAAGEDVCFAQAEWTLPEAEHRMRQVLWDAKMPVISGLELRKHFHVRGHLRDAKRLRERLITGEFDVVHTHLLADHLVAAWAVRGLERKLVLVRSLYELEAPKRSWRARLAFRHSDGVVVPTRCAAGQMVERFGFSADQVLYQDPPIDSLRLLGHGDLRERWGLNADHFVIGITARIQPHRRFELLWEVVRYVAARCPQVRFVLLGRGNAQDTEALVRAPVRDLGLESQVILPGYLTEPDYSHALRTLNAFFFLVPGSDGTCRAVREAMALGLPVVTTKRGILPELIAEHPDCPGAGASGFNCDETPEALGGAVLRLIEDSGMRASMGAAAATRAAGPMNPKVATARLRGFYDRLASRSAGRRG